MGRLAQMMRRSPRRLAELRALHRYAGEDLGADVVAWLEPGHRRFVMPQEGGLSRCALKASLASALRAHFGPRWFTQIDAPYPASRGHDGGEVADVLLWSPMGSPIVFEVCESSDYERVSQDFDKVGRHAETLRSSPVQCGYVVFPVTCARKLRFWEQMRNAWQPVYPLPVPFLGDFTLRV